MKTNIKKAKSNCLTLLILILFLTSCRREQRNSENNFDSVTVDTTVAYEPPVINQDSIDKANALAREEKERKTLDAYNYISSFSKELMGIVSPNTGKNSVYEIIEDESTYNELTSTLTAVFESRWEAIPDFNPNSTYQTHVYKGKLILYGNGETRQETISKNDVLIRAIEANEGMEKFNSFINKLDNNE